MSITKRRTAAGKDHYRWEARRGGQRITGTAETKQEAQQARDIALGRLQDQAFMARFGIPRRAQLVTVRAFYEGDFLRWLDSTYSSRVTRLSVRQGLQPFLALAGALPLRAVTPDVMERYKISRAGAVQASTLRTQIAYVKTFFRASRRLGLTVVDPTEFLALPPIERRPYPLPSAALIDALFASLAPRPAIRDMVRLSSLTGLRRAEICQLRVRDVRLDKRLLVVFQEKTRLTKSVPLVTDAVALLRPYLAGASAIDPVFRSRYRKAYTPNGFGASFRQLRQKAKLPRVWLHLLRHAVAMRLQEQGEKRAVIGAILGHTPPYHATGVYTQHTTDGELRLAMERAFGDLRQESEDRLRERITGLEAELAALRSGSGLPPSHHHETAAG